MRRLSESPESSTETSSIRLPTLSVVVAFRKSERCVFDCLQSLLDMDYPFEKLDVIAVDDGRDDSTVEALRRRFPVIGIVRNDESKGSDKAKQLGVEAATGDVLALTDADCTVHPRWARVIARNLADGADAVTGPVKHPKVFLKELIGVSDFQDFQGVRRQTASSCPGCNFAADRDAFQAIAYRRNGDMDFGSDRLTSWQMHQSGSRMVFDPEMVVYHSPSVSIAGIWERRLRYGRKALALRKLDGTLPGSAITRLGPLAAPAYVCYRSAKDAYRLLEMAGRRIVNPWHVPLLIPALIFFRMMDAAGIVSAQIRK